MVKECGEEAGVPPAMARAAIATGAVSYTALQEDGAGRPVLKRDVLFC